ncbi:hypothetical protein BDQ17DRAFT_1250108 [Cyathus striatus]|nr:hypothetical protein BDQ17DRAFT_1250108 [Cyathus striatus]
MDSPPNLRQHLGTNYIPSTKEMRQISDFLDASDDDIRDIGIEIDMLRRQWDLLLEKRSKIHDLAEQHRALISPARRLSRDILEEIFLACLPADRNPCMSATEAPMLLTQVCSSWRSIARSAPRLWSAIHIALPLVSATQYSPVGYLSLREEKVRLRMDHLATATKQWLDRSGACPLSISVFMAKRDSLLMVSMFFCRKCVSYI